MIQIERERAPRDLLPAIEQLFSLSAGKIRAIESAWNPADGAPVFTIAGRYAARGWTEWTQGFQFGSALLQFDATHDTSFLELGRSRTVERMAPHLTHVGVHDHGFNNVSTYGALWRMAREERFDAQPWELRFYELGKQSANLGASVSLVLLANTALLPLTGDDYTLAFWWLHIAGVAGVLGACIAMAVSKRMSKTAHDVLAPVLNRDPLVAFELGLSPAVHRFVASL